jgi:hypothetical protein
MTPSGEIQEANRGPYTDYQLPTTGNVTKQEARGVNYGQEI